MFLLSRVGEALRSVISSRKIRNKCLNDPFFQQFILNWNNQERLVKQKATVVLFFLLNFTYFINEGIKNRLVDITSFRVCFSLPSSARKRRNKIF
jgi:hypothetical protein